MAVGKQPENPLGYQALAKLYASEKKFDETVTIIRSGFQLLPDSMILQLELAGALEQSKQYEAAISEYELILSKQPGSMIVANTSRFCF